MREPMYHSGEIRHDCQDTSGYVRRFLEAKAYNLAPRSLEDYHYRLGLFCRECPELPLEPEPIEAFLARRTGSPHNIDTYYRRLRAFYRWLTRRKLITVNPIECVERPRLPRKHAWAPDQDTLFDVMKAPGRKTTRALVALLANTGLRLSEALSVTAERVNVYYYRSRRHYTVTVHGKTGEREVPVSASVMQKVLRALPWPWASSQAASKAVKRQYGKVGVHRHRAAAHSFRHAFVRQWRGRDRTLIGIMGWTSPRMLMVYRPYDVQDAVKEHSRYVLSQSKGHVRLRRSP